jgi:ribosomal protein S18 acetylase RimI-like enzyme
MVKTDTLENVKIQELTEAYNLGFSDYQLTLSMSEKKLQQILKKNGYRAESSVGLFDREKLVGFVLNGVRGNYCYDSGTAIIPAYRGKGYAHLLLEKALSVLKDQAIHTWVLEVLSDNTRAINLYRGIGFTRQRGFNCYHTKTEKTRENKPATALVLSRQKTIRIPQGECLPSWQSEEQAIIAGEIPVWDIQLEEKNVGTICFDPATGSIAQLYIQDEERRKGFAKGAIIEAAKLCKAEQLRFINIDESYLPLNKLLLSLGFTCFTTQLEMTNTIRGKG